MKMYDASVPLRVPMVGWPGDPAFGKSEVSHIDRGDAATVHLIQMTTHTGTHIDAPGHFISTGYSVDAIPLEALIGSCVVVECLDPVVSRDFFTQQFHRGPIPSRILVKTENSRRRLLDSNEFHQDFVALDEGAARWLVENKVLTIGVDYLSIERFDSPQHPVHKILLGAAIAVLEGVRLVAVPVGSYQLTALPLRLEGQDGSPARIILIEDGVTS